MRDLKAALEGRVGFVSTGTPEGDAEESRRIIRMAANEAEGLCPNGCAPMEPHPDVTGAWRCPVCGCFTNYEPGVK